MKAILCNNGAAVLLQLLLQLLLQQPEQKVTSNAPSKFARPHSVDPEVRDLALPQEIGATGKCA